MSNALEIFDRAYGPGMDIVGAHLLRQAGLSKIQSALEEGQTRIDLPFAIRSDLKFSDRIYPAGDRLILKDAVKKACDTYYRQANRKIIWLETNGRVKLSKDKQTSIPLGLYAEGQVGFSLSNEVRLRKLEPYESASGELAKGASFLQSIQIPYTAQLARSMPPGSEFELSEEARAKFSLELPAGVQASKTRCASIFAQKLLSPNKIMVKLTTSSGNEGGLGYEYRNERRLSFCIFQTITHVVGLDRFFSWIASAHAVAAAKRTNQQNHIKQYVFDLSKAEEAQAYDDIFLKFSTERADKIARKQVSEETETSYDFNAAGGIGDSNVTFFHKMESAKESYLSDNHYQKSTSLREHFSKWFSKMSIMWEWMSLDNPNKSLNKSYCHVTVDSPNATDFFELTEALEIPLLNDAKEILLSDPATNIHIDVYFSEKGIQNIQNSSMIEDFGSYLTKQLPIGTDQATALRYGEILNKSIFTRWFFSRERGRMEKANPILISHKTRIREAYAFAKKTNPFKGSLGRFSDIRSIVALMRVAGLKETIVHELSISNPSIGLFNPDEGQILNPEQEFTQRLASLSSPEVSP
ncbi:MAG: hypothetical protein V4534_01055 [Myxococcota bacterium]